MPIDRRNIASRERGPMETGTCLQCSKEFVKTHVAKAYCSVECSTRAKVTRRCAAVAKKRVESRVVLECKACSKRFMPKMGNQVYCSVDCRGKTKGSCHYCGKDFDGGTKYCSQSCKLTHYRVLRSK